MKLFSITMVAFTLLFSSFSRSEAVTGEEYQAVVDTAYMYFNGAAKGDQELLAKAFDQEFGHVKMIRVDSDTKEETIRTVPLKEFSGYFKNATKDKWEANILSVDIVDNKMAMVKMDFHTPKTHYVDYLVMYKRQNAWRIVTKTFVAKNKL
ncbi:nuclear transport factor 2 family protein [Pseudoalteromonas sp. OOF1S-7]|uniref:nuclear transport factor 2 family protein n=1 Tax=Pseudoalteromonas sp. OOF1S-7 TaxID=2917757 RepID=UPI001EF570F8|nr:nuclear transport factor 2 family protein [Pseudoalteromonas sp. OOF1S-7]MCG7537090.1 nuclear transport factor 2 family protein [Pseudoalteromonas sp. OOF1S-7]